MLFNTHCSLRELFECRTQDASSGKPLASKICDSLHSVRNITLTLFDICTILKIYRVGYLIFNALYPSHIQDALNCSDNKKGNKKEPGLGNAIMLLAEATKVSSRTPSMIS